MKNIKIISVVILLTFVFDSCKKDNPNPTTSANTQLIVGTWRVSSFTKEGVDITSQFANFTFNCTSNGSMTIHDNGNTYNCNWNDLDNDHSMYNFHIMGCDDSSVLWECNEDWDLTSHDASHCYFTTHNPHHNSTMTWTKD